MEFGVLVDPVVGPAELVDLAQQAEEWGYTYFWYPDEKFFRECYVGLTLVAANTRRLKLGPCVTDPYSRHPIMTAAAVATLAEIAPGRVWLGLGAGGRGLREMGLAQTRPARALREAIEIIRGLMSGESVTYQGEVISLENRPLDFVPSGPVPIMIGTGHGRHIQQLAGEIADAAMLANYASPAAIGKGLSFVEQGAAKVGRKLREIHLISRVDVAVHPDSREARKALAPKVLSAVRASYPDLNYLDDLPPFEMSSAFLSILNKKDHHTKSYYAVPDHSAPLVPDALIDHLGVAGTPEEVAVRLQALGALGFNQITIRAVPAHGQTMPECLRLVSESVLPALKN